MQVVLTSYGYEQIQKRYGAFTHNPNLDRVKLEKFVADFYRASIYCFNLAEKLSGLVDDYSRWFSRGYDDLADLLTSDNKILDAVRRRFEETGAGAGSIGYSTICDMQAPLRAYILAKKDFAKLPQVGYITGAINNPLSDRRGEVLGVEGLADVLLRTEAGVEIFDTRAAAVPGRGLSRSESFDSEASGSGSEGSYACDSGIDPISGLLGIHIPIDHRPWNDSRESGLGGFHTPPPNLPQPLIGAVVPPLPYRTPERATKLPPKYPPPLMVDWEGGSSSSGEDLHREFCLESLGYGTEYKQ